MGRLIEFFSKTFSSPNSRATPTQASLTRLLRGVTRVRIATHTKRMKLETVAVVEDPDALKDLHTVLAVYDGGAGHCMCTGDPQLFLEYQKDEGQAEEEHISVHHGRGIRWDKGWSSDASLKRGFQLLEWLDKHGYPQALQAYHDARERGRLEAEQSKRWEKATPLCLRGVRVDTFGNTCMEEAVSLIEEGIPNPHERCRKLLEWYGSGEGPWSGYPAEERTALELLEKQSPKTLVEAAESEPETAELLEGSARFFAMTETKADTRQCFPNQLRTRLLDHVTRGGNKDNLARFNAALGATLAPEGLLKMIKTDWSSLDAASATVDDFYTFPNGAWFVPCHPASTFIGWVERLAWWDEYWVIHSAFVSLTFTLEAQGQPLEASMRAALSAMENWRADPSSKSLQKAVENSYKELRGAKVPEKIAAKDYLVDSASWLCWAVEGNNHFRALSSIEYVLTALSSICAGKPERANEFEWDDSNVYRKEAELQLTRQIRLHVEPAIQSFLKTPQAKK